MSDSIFNATVAKPGELRPIEEPAASPQRNVNDHAHAEGQHLEIADLIRIILVGAGAAASWLRLWEPFPRFDIIGLVASLAGGYPIFREALEDIRSRRMTMELSMTIALGAALAIGEFFTAALIVFFVLIAEVLEELTVGRGRKAIQELIDFLPRRAEVRREGSVQEVAAGEVRAGDVVLVRPGGRVPVDGTVEAGHSFLDQSTVTGESMPVEKVPGSQVFAGTINQAGVIEVRTVKLGRDTAFGRIIEAVERAEKSRAPIQRLANRLAGYLVYFAIGCAILTLVITHNLRSNHLRGDCSWGLRDCGRHTAGHPGRHRQGGPRGRHRQGWSLHGAAGCRRYGHSGQDGYPDPRHPRSY